MKCKIVIKYDALGENFILRYTDFWDAGIGFTARLWCCIASFWTVPSGLKFQNAANEGDWFERKFNGVSA
jgi:hypothetical protein